MKLLYGTGNLAKKYGDLVARYKNAICFVRDPEHIYEAMEPSMESEKFILTDRPHSTIRKKVFRWIACLWISRRSNTITTCRKINYSRSLSRMDF